MVVVAQLVRAPDCGSGGRRFETGLPPKNPHCIYESHDWCNEGVFFYYDSSKVKRIYMSLLLGKSN